MSFRGYFKMRWLVVLVVSATPSEVGKQVEGEFPILLRVFDGLELGLGLCLVAVLGLVCESPRLLAVGHCDESSVQEAAPEALLEAPMEVA